MPLDLLETVPTATANDVRQTEQVREACQHPPVARADEDCGKAGVTGVAAAIPDGLVGWRATRVYGNPVVPAVPQGRRCPANHLSGRPPVSSASRCGYGPPLARSTASIAVLTPSSAIRATVSRGFQ